jgi:enterobacterial common antigen flippase
VDVTIASVLFVVASLVSMVACLVGLSCPFRGPSEPPVPQLLKESRPYAFSMLVTDLFDRLDIVLVLWLVPLIEQGFYAAMTPVVYPLTVIPNTLGLFLFNAGASADTKLTKRDVLSVLGSTLAIQTVSTVVFLLLIGPVVVLLYGEEFRPAIVFALWLAPVSALRGVLQGLDSYLKGRGQPLAPVRARLFAMFVMIVTTALLFSRFEAIAIAMAALVGQIVCFVWLSLLVYTDVQDRVENAEIS